MTHTPGPWKVAKYQVGTVVTNYEPKEGRTVGYSCGNDFVADLDDGKYHKYLDEKEREANARLIAAAPDLLDALKDAVAKLEKDARDTATAFGITEWRKTAPHTAEITSRARAALKEPDT